MMDRPDQIERDGTIAVLEIDTGSRDTWSTDRLDALLRDIETVAADDGIAGVVLVVGGDDGSPDRDRAAHQMPVGPSCMGRVIAAIEMAGKPFVAAVQGVALDDWYELALGCDARVATPGARVGLTQCARGVVPGAGGTQRLPRLVGRAEAIRLIAGAIEVTAEKALGPGLVDAVAAQDLQSAAILMARDMAGTKRRLIDRPVPDDVDGDAAAERASRKARPHVLAAIHHIREAGTITARDGLDAERATAERMHDTPEATALRHIFLAEREAARGMPGREAAPVPVDLFGVIGSGTMGAGIATAILQAGKPVVLMDANADALAKGVARIEDAIDGAVARGRLSRPDGEAAKGRLTTGTELSALARCDLVIEAVFEDQRVKEELFGKLGVVLGADAIVATNTSYLDIDRMAAKVPRPEHVIGLHFFSPAHIMKLLEVVRGSASGDRAMATGLGVAGLLGKQPVEAANSFGFIGNRIYAAYRAACEFLLEDGALPHEVDRALEAFGFAMGPFAVADLSGLDIAWTMRRQRVADRDPQDRYVHIPDRLCEAGRFGRKTGAGYYRYDAEGARHRDPKVEALIIAASAEKGIARHSLAALDIQRRALAAMVNEAACIVAEGVALRPSDIDVVMVNGYGFPRWTGGPVHWARQQAPEALAGDCARFAMDAGPGRQNGDLRLLGVGSGGTK